MVSWSSSGPHASEGVQLAPASSLKEASEQAPPSCVLKLRLLKGSTAVMASRVVIAVVGLASAGLGRCPGVYPINGTLERSAPLDGAAGRGPLLRADSATAEKRVECGPDVTAVADHVVARPRPVELAAIDQMQVCVKQERVRRAH